MPAGSMEMARDAWPSVMLENGSILVSVHGIHNIQYEISLGSANMTMGMQLGHR